jgi:hypothetical protein
MCHRRARHFRRQRRHQPPHGVFGLRAAEEEQRGPDDDRCECRRDRTAKSSAAALAYACHDREPERHARRRQRRPRPGHPHSAPARRGAGDGEHAFAARLSDEGEKPGRPQSRGHAERVRVEQRSRGPMQHGPDSYAQKAEIEHALVQAEHAADDHARRQRPGDAPVELLVGALRQMPE